VIILFIIVWGMAAGWIAQLIMGEQTNWGQALAVGLLGSLVGGLLASLISGDGLELRLSGIIGSIVGAVILLALLRLVRPSARRN
jgi:uncharacterized membrane protein YeaQ/YmgE (transglycosylase-associated protein family)